MTTEKKTDNKSAPAVSDNKIILAPLGKYAAIAVIMVSIIVSTAIMLDKQLNTVDEKIATIKSKAIESHTEDSSLTDTTASTSTESETTADVANTSEKPQNTKVAVKPVTDEPSINKAATDDVYITSETKTEITLQAATTASSTLNTQEVAATESISNTDVVKPVAVVTENAKQASLAELTITHNDKAANKASFDQERQAHIEAVKLEKKQRMSEMFARIKVLESQQLDHYKAVQEKQITRLRERIAQQQKMINALVLRNKDLFELRAASIERRQTNREQMLNRI